MTPRKPWHTSPLAATMTDRFREQVAVFRFLARVTVVGECWIYG